VAMPRSWHYVYLYLHAMIIFYFNRILLHQWQHFQKLESLMAHLLLVAAFI
jgi:hypothetical protein